MPTSPAGRLARDPVHAAGLAGLGHLRQERHRGGARLRAGAVSDRLRHRGRPQRAARPRRRGQRGVPRRRRRACRPDEPYLFGRHRVSGADPERRSYRSFASFKRSRRQRLAVPGDHRAIARTRRRDDTTFTSSTDLAAALRRAAAAHGEHEKRNGGQHDANWPDWYAEYIVKRAGRRTAAVELRHATAVTRSILNGRRHRSQS